jgi:nucleotide-binding universal stress UspA family protein
LILTASDATEQSDAVVAAAIDLGKKIAADVTIIHVLTEQRLADLRQSLGSEEAYTDAVMTLISDALGDQLRRVADDPDAADKLVVHGPVGMTILDQAASLNADFLALGLRNRSRVGKFLMGSDVQQILLSTPCPVLGVPV